MGSVHDELGGMHHQCRCVEGGEVSDLREGCKSASLLSQQVVRIRQKSKDWFNPDEDDPTCDSLPLKCWDAKTLG